MLFRMKKEINQWVISILNSWNTPEFENIIRNYYAKDYSYRIHMQIMNKIYERNQIVYYDTENILSSLNQLENGECI